MLSHQRWCFSTITTNSTHNAIPLILMQVSLECLDVFSKMLAKVSYNEDSFTNSRCTAFESQDPAPKSSMPALPPNLHDYAAALDLEADKILREYAVALGLRAKEFSGGSSTVTSSISTASAKAGSSSSTPGRQTAQNPTSYSIISRARWQLAMIRDPDQPR